MPHYAIGDVQGCYAELMSLLDTIAFNEKTDTLWFAGDMINGGPNNLDVLRFISQLPQKPVVILGNHDLHFLAVFHKIREIQPDDTFQDILNAPDVEKLAHWLQSQSLAHYDPVLNYLMVHAGISPLWSLQDTLHYAKEIETALNPAINSRHPGNAQQDIHRFLMAIFGIKQDEQSMHWRLITDTFTRIRFCDDQGKLNLSYKRDIAHAPAGVRPWFDYRKNPPCAPLYQRGGHSDGLVKKEDLKHSARSSALPIWHPDAAPKPTDILFGHWAALEKESISEYPHLFALDTGCVWGGKLSALRLDDKQWFQVTGKKYR
jgi:bis(5'-nucleosyl)-tetraphosphatase (symmetrical)